MMSLKTRQIPFRSTTLASVTSSTTPTTSTPPRGSRSRSWCTRMRETLWYASGLDPSIHFLNPVHPLSGHGESEPNLSAVAGPVTFLIFCPPCRHVWLCRGSSYVSWETFLKVNTQTPYPSCPAPSTVRPTGAAEGWAVWWDWTR